MSDDAANTPPRKVGSLRDRIAQFESKPAAAAPAPPPKPSGAKKTWAWKEKQAEIPPPPVAAPSAAPPATSAASSSSALVPESEHRDDHEEQATHGGMSAEDAKNAISQGGGLKARLAALQGSGFGAPVDASPVPPPSSGKPRVWKKAIVHHEPTPKPQHVLSEDDEEHDVPPAHDEETHAEPDVPQTAEADSADEPQDDAAEERQRRAAIAARMARLGGARVGMPVVFGKGPAPPPPKRDSDDSGSAVVSPPVPSKKLSIDDASSLRPESASEVTDTDLTQEETEYPETSTEDDRSIMPSSSPPRVRPPIPAARAWSPSPPASPKPMSRPEIISQGSSFSIPRSVYEYPPTLYPVVARASGGIGLADHLRNNRSPSPITSSPLSLSPISASPASSISPQLYPPPSSHSPAVPRHQRPLSTRHSDSALRSSMVTDNNPLFLHGHQSIQSRSREPKGYFGPSLFTTQGAPSNFLSLNHSASPISPPTRYPTSNVYPYSEAADLAERETDLNTVSHAVPGGPPVSRLSRRASSSSFYPRPLARSVTPPPTSKAPVSLSSEASGRGPLRFRLFGWLKKRRLTESSLPSSSSIYSSNITPAARIKSKYQLSSGMMSSSTTSLDRSASTNTVPNSLRRMPPPPELPIYSDDVVLMNSPVDETPPPLPPKKNAPPRPARPHTPSSTRSESPGGSSVGGDSRPRRLQRQNVLRASPAPFSNRKPSFGSETGSMISLARSASLRSNASAPVHMAQLHTLMPNHPPASATLKHARGDLPFPLPLPAAHSADDVTTPVSNAGMTWFDTDFEIDRK